MLIGKFIYPVLVALVLTAVSSSVGCPEVGVVADLLHDQLRVFVRCVALGQSRGLIQGRFCDLKSLFRRLEDLVAEDGKVQGKTEMDGVFHRLCDVKRFLSKRNNIKIIRSSS